MDERDWQDEGGQFGDEGNPRGAKAPKSSGVEEFAGESNPKGIRPDDLESQGERGDRDDQGDQDDGQDQHDGG